MMAILSPLSLEAQAQSCRESAAYLRQVAADCCDQEGVCDYEDQGHYLSQAEIDEKYAEQLQAEADAIYLEIESMFPPVRKNRRVRLCE